jgi:hypothetical protein
MITSDWIVLRMKIFSDKVEKKIKKRFLFSIFFSEILTVFEIMCKKFYGPRHVPYDNTGIIRGMRFACWIPKSTNTHSEYVIILLLPDNNGCTSAHQHYVKTTLPVIL